MMYNIHNKPKMIDLLKNTVCEVVFTKADGEKRQGFFTLRPDIIEEFSEVEQDNSDKPKRELSEDSPAIRVFEVPADPEGDFQWRSFVVDRVETFRYKDTYSDLWVSI